MADVWIVQSGDYENRDVTAVFATEQLAREYAGDDGARDVTRHAVWDRIPQPVTRWELLGVTGDPIDREDFDQVAGGSVRGLQQYASTEVHCPPVTEEVDWWSWDPSPVAVRVYGYDLEAVTRRFAELWAEVLEGRRRPEGAAPRRRRI